jgi:Flp pilus assembly protein TadG
MGVRHWLGKVAAFFVGRQTRYRKASIALMSALALPTVIYTTGFTVDIGMWFTQSTTLQSATDAAAVKAARDLATHPGTTSATLKTDALAAATAVSTLPLNIKATMLTTKQLTDPRQVEVDASVPALQFFSNLLYPISVTIHASSIAGVAYNTISSQATCYSIDSYTYLYSTGLATLDTSHSAGIDPFQCGSPPSPPSAYNAYCGGGILSCKLNILNAGSLLPFAVQIGPNGGAGGLSLVLANIQQSLSNLLGGNSSATGTPTFVGQGSSYCSGTVCTVPAGTYIGGVTVGPNVTVNFVSSGTNNTFLMVNGNLIIDNSDKLGGTNNDADIFYFAGNTPGALIFRTQVEVNTAPVNNGSIVMTSTSTFQSNGSLAGTETSAPISAMPYAQSAAVTDGLLSTLGLPGGNVVGTNFESVVATCADAVSNCSNPVEQPAQFQSTALPSLSGLSPLLLGLLPSAAAIANATSESEVSTTTITSDITLANGVPTDWLQKETEASTLTPASVANVLAALGLSGYSAVLTPVLQPILSAMVSSPSETSTQSSAGVFTGQTSQGTPTGTCGATQAVLYSSGNSLQPSFGPGFSDILNSSGIGSTSGALSTSDSVTICGTSETASITPMTPGQTLVASTAAGSSTLALLK